MAALTTMVVAGAAVAAGAVALNNQQKHQKKMQRQARRASQKQQEAAREATKLRGKDPQEARVKIGAGDGTAKRRAQGSNEKGQATQRQTMGVNAKRLFGSGTSASKIGGL